MICSLTRAAAAEVGGRDTGIPPEHVATLHALCYRALGRPDIVEGKHVKEWNELHPGMALNGDASGDVDDSKGGDYGGTLIEQSDLLRARRTPRERWPKHLLVFDDAWKKFKEERSLCDFTDLIERGLRELPYAPGNPNVILGDECQDWSRLEIDLVRKWSRETDHLVLCGDPLQALFAFRGSDPNILSLDGIPDSHIRVPREEDDIGERGRGWRASPQKSYRVPAELKTLARKVVSGLPGSEVDFISTEVEGSVHRAGFSFRAPERLGDVLPKLDGSVMILASCEHMLRPTEAWLRKEGVPYHNPYAKRWNPLRSTWKKLAGYIAPSAREGLPYERLSLDEVKAWAELLRAQDVFVRGGKTRILNASAEEPLPRLLPECFTEDAFDKLWDGDLEWFLAHADPSKGVAYPGAVLKRIGAESMMLAMSLPPKDRPFVTLGTMHSVKGGEADHVLVYPDIARASWEEAQRPGWSGVEATSRLFYVAITRAKKSLWIGQPDGKHFVRL